MRVCAHCRGRSVGGSAFSPLPVFPFAIHISPSLSLHRLRLVAARGVFFRGYQRGEFFNACIYCSHSHTHVRAHKHAHAHAHTYVNYNTLMYTRVHVCALFDHSSVCSCARGVMNVHASSPLSPLGSFESAYVCDCVCTWVQSKHKLALDVRARR